MKPAKSLLDSSSPSQPMAATVRIRHADLKAVPYFVAQSLAAKADLIVT